MMTQRFLASAIAVAWATGATACPITDSMRDLMLAPDDAAVHEIVVACAASDFDFSAPLPDGKVPFWHIVATRSLPETVALMLDAGADPNTTDQYGEPAVTAAINFVFDANDPAFLAMMRVLGEAGADFSRPDSHGETNLARAAGGGELQLTRLLLQYGADPNGLNTYGRTPLFSTVFGTCQPEIGEALIKAGGGISTMPTDQIDRFFVEAQASCSDTAEGQAYIAQLAELRP